MIESDNKTKRTYNTPGHAHYLTFNCVHNWPLLTTDRSRQWVIEAIEALRSNHDCAIAAYVIMPEHIHILLRPNQRDYDMARITGALKRPVSVKAKAYLESVGDTEWLNRLTIRRGERRVFRFWLQGSGHDRNLWKPETIRRAINYTHMNPVRRGLVTRPTDWPWSSARFWDDQKDVPLKMDRII